MKLKDVALSRIVIKENVRIDPDDEIGEIMDSIERFDIIQPVLVVPRGDKYELVSGHRRFAAMKARNEYSIPAYIREDLSDADIPIVKLTENIHRKQMSPHELVRIFEQMKASDPKLKTHAQIAAKIGKPVVWVDYKYAADRVYQQLINSGVEIGVLEHLTESELMKLARVKDPAEKAEIARRRVKGKRKPRIETAESYSLSSRKQFQFRVVARRKLEVLCGTDAAMGKLLDYLGADGQ